MKFYGKVGFVATRRMAPGVMAPLAIEERNYYGDVLRWSPRTEVSTDKANDEIQVNNQISIVADPYANNHLHEIKYVDWAGCKWRVRSVNVNYPRLILEIGGVYPEQEVDYEDGTPEYED